MLMSHSVFRTPSIAPAALHDASMTPSTTHRPCLACAVHFRRHSPWAHALRASPPVLTAEARLASSSRANRVRLQLSAALPVPAAPQGGSEPLGSSSVSAKAASSSGDETTAAGAAAAPEQQPGEQQAGSDDGGQAVEIDLELPRRSRLVSFKCNLCGETTERLVNPIAWDKGMVICQCAGCQAWHKLADAANLVEEIRYSELENMNSDDE